MIRIKGLNKFYNKGKQNQIHVINNTELSLPEKGMVALFGKSGCGKTTLLNVIGGLDGFSSGIVEIAGNNIRRNTDALRNKYIGYIFQNYNLSNNESCFENIANALRLCGMTDGKEIEKRVNAALHLVDMDKYGKRTPDTLSGGQQQRIAIARAIVKNPKIILADEPTGNLDEINTVMIMDLLKKISKDHLVILVTHEEKLVDYYCQSVIELRDGKVVNVKNNLSAEGYVAKNKNHIYLGDLEKSSISHPDVNIEYYGQPRSIPISLKVVNYEGKTYIEIESTGVTVLDSGSEIKLKSGVYKEEAAKERDEAMDLSQLPPFEGKRFGRLFSLVSSIKSGYIANFKANNVKKGKKALKRCLSLFAMVLVVISTTLGGAFDDLIRASSSYNHNVFYVYTTEEVSKKLVEGLGKEESGIDDMRIHYGFSIGDEELSFAVNSFESFTTTMFDTGLSANGVLFSFDRADEYELVAGKNSGLEGDEMVITTAVADKVLEKSSVGYIEDYRDLIGLAVQEFSLTSVSYSDYAGLKIGGVVESDENALFIDGLAIARNVVGRIDYNVLLENDLGVKCDVLPGQVTLLKTGSFDENVDYPTEGEKIMIGGVSVTVGDVIYQCRDYVEWLSLNGIERMQEEEYFAHLVENESPGIDRDSQEYQNILGRIMDERYFEWYDYYYSEIDEFIKDFSAFELTFDTWLYVDKGFDIIKYTFIRGENYYRAVKYKEIHGTYPLLSEYEKATEEIDDMWSEIKKLYNTYEGEFNKDVVGNYIYWSSYIMDESDYKKLALSVGQTHDSALPSYKDFYGGEGEDYLYTVIHSKDPSKTEKWLDDNFGDLTTNSSRHPAIVTPNRVFEGVLEENRIEIIASLVSMACVVVILCVCMYFIMRSTLMVRIREVGIYRAIGVSKKNLVFKFLVEAGVLTSLTVTVGYLLSSGFIGVCHYLSPLAKEVMYYPPWLALIVLLLLYSICLLCGIIPIISLLRKTPSEIIAKYDI